MIPICYCLFCFVLFPLLHLQRLPIITDFAVYLPYRVRYLYVILNQHSVCWHSLHSHHAGSGGGEKSKRASTGRAGVHRDSLHRSGGGGVERRRERCVLQLGWLHSEQHTLDRLAMATWPVSLYMNMITTLYRIYTRYLSSDARKQCQCASFNR